MISNIKNISWAIDSVIDVLSEENFCVKGCLAFSFFFRPSFQFGWFTNLPLQILVLDKESVVFGFQNIKLLLFLG